MPLRKKPRRPVYLELRFPRFSRGTKIGLTAALCILLLIAGLINISYFLRRLTAEMAMSDAIDMVTLAVNEAVQDIMSEEDYAYDYFVRLEKDSEGNICALGTNVSRINSISAEILSRVVGAAENGRLDLRVPVGNLLGSNLLLGKGPEVPVEIITLTSSYIDIENELLSTGINQAKHKIVLKIDVDIDILVPWDVITTTVETRVLIAETVIVGSVPETYIAVE